MRNVPSFDWYVSYDVGTTAGLPQPEMPGSSPNTAASDTIVLAQLFTMVSFAMSLLGNCGNTGGKPTDKAHVNQDQGCQQRSGVQGR